MREKKGRPIFFPFISVGRPYLLSSHFSLHGQLKRQLWGRRKGKKKAATLRAHAAGHKVADACGQLKRPWEVMSDSEPVAKPVFFPRPHISCRFDWLISACGFGWRQDIRRGGWLACLLTPFMSAYDSKEIKRLMTDNDRHFSFFSFLSFSGRYRSWCLLSSLASCGAAINTEK